MTTATIMPGMSAATQSGLKGSFVRVASSVAETTKSAVVSAWSWLKKFTAAIWAKARQAVSSAAGLVRTALGSHAAIGGVATALATPSGSRLAAVLVDKAIRAGGRGLAWFGGMSVGLVRSLGSALTSIVAVFSDSAAVRFDAFWTKRIDSTLSKAMLSMLMFVAGSYTRIREAFTTRLTMIATTVVAAIVAVAQWAQVVPGLSALAAPVLSGFAGLPLIGSLFGAAFATGFAPLMIIAGVACAAAGVSAMSIKIKSQVDEITVTAEGVSVPVGPNGEAFIPAADMPNVVRETNRQAQNQRNAANMRNNPNQQRRS